MSGNPLVNQMNNSNFINAIQNSPFMKVANAVRAGGNPQVLLPQLFGGNTNQMNQMMGRVKGKSLEQLGQEMKDEANKKGIDINQLTQTLGVPESALKAMGLI